MAVTDMFRPQALSLEREAATRYREFEGWFAEHNLPEFAARCRKLSVTHGERCLELADASDLAEGAVPTEPAIFYQLAGPRQLLEVALDAELEALRLYQHVCEDTADLVMHAHATTLAENALRCVGQIVAAIDEVGPVDWESVIASGGGPGLALGAERRLRSAR